MLGTGPLIPISARLHPRTLQCLEEEQVEPIPSPYRPGGSGDGGWQALRAETFPNLGWFGLLLLHHDPGETRPQTQNAEQMKND